MSLQSLANRPTSRQKLQDMAIAQDAMQEVESYLEGCYDLNYWELTQDEADAIAAWDGSWVGEKWNQKQFSFGTFSFEEFVQHWKSKGKSAGAIYIACRIWSGATPGLKKLASDWHSHRAIKNSLTEEEFREISANAANLRQLGIKTGWQARKFYELYKEVMVGDRPWGSCYQPNQRTVLAIATTPNFTRLPLWVKKILVNQNHINVDRPGDIWRLIPCAKAWKWCPNLPKNIAEQIGKTASIKSRVYAAIAWDGMRYYDSRAERTTAFWQRFRTLEQMPITTLLEECYFDSGKTRQIAEILLDLPHQALLESWNKEDIAGSIVGFLSPKQACETLLGCTGKATVRAFQECDRTRWQWAGALAFGHPDAVQKILGMDTIIGFQPDAVGFLNSLPMVSRLRMLQATTFKYRGEVQPISNDHVRDTGYLWKNIENKPELGRIRCWFSVHETLAAAFVKELPDEALPIPTGWERLDGLCAVDGSWELEFPKRVATLKYWGEVQHNCVGGYGPAIKQGRSVIFVVREQGQITHTVEYSNGHCNQFYQSGNSQPDYEIKISVTDAIAQAFGDANYSIEW